VKSPIVSANSWFHQEKAIPPAGPRVWNSLLGEIMTSQDNFDQTFYRKSYRSAYFTCYQPWISLLLKQLWFTGWLNKAIDETDITANQLLQSTYSCFTSMTLSVIEVEKEDFNANP